MLLDCRGHLKLTDLGLCKKVGDVSRSDEPEQILDMMRRQTLKEQPASGGADALKASPVQTTNKHRTSDDAMAMSFDDMPPSMKRDAKTRREVRSCVVLVDIFSLFCCWCKSHTFQTLSTTTTTDGLLDGGNA